MSDKSSPAPDGVGSEGGGGLKARRAPCPPTITNQQQLVLPADITDDLSPAAQHRLKVIQIEFAKGVSEQSAQAYQQVLETLDGCKPKDR